MSDILFSSSMIKCTPVRRKEDVVNIIQLKIIEDSTNRTFPFQFTGQIEFNGLFDHNATNDCWDKVNISLIEESLNYTVDFSEVEFDAKLENISATRKMTKENTPYTEYILTFMKDLDKDLDTKINYYIKRKEEDPETGKKTLAFYPTSLKII